MKRVVVNIVGTRPNFMKIAPILRAYKKYPKIKSVLIHTGQHYDYDLSKVFFRDLAIPKPVVSLGIGSGNLAEQTAKTMIALEPILMKLKPDMVVVVGDVNSTAAGALTAKYLNLSVAHIEAGLRSFDLTMPEEINRMLTDKISDLLFVTEKSGIVNLLKEGVKKNKIHFVGNTMIDSLKNGCSKIKIKKFKGTTFAVLTLHRPSNVDNKNTLGRIAVILDKIRKIGINIVFPVHPRTLKNIKKFGLQKKFRNINLMPPLGYLEFIKVVREASFVLTDSGGIQEETAWLGIPCLTMRKNTERPVTLMKSTNTLVGINERKIMVNVKKIMAGKYKQGRDIPLWDGKAAQRIVKIIHDYLEF